MDVGINSRPDVPSITTRLSLGIALLAYLVATVLLFFFGPWVYPLAQSSRPLVTFLVAVHLAFGCGYLLGIRGRAAATRIATPPAMLALVCAVVTLLLVFPTSAQNTGSWWPRPWTALSNLGGAYDRSLLLRDEGTPYGIYLRILLAPCLFASVPLGVFYWRHLSRLTRAIFIASVVGTVALFVSMGANAGIAEWMVLLPWFALASHWSGVQRLTHRGWLTLAALAGLAVLVFATFFTATMLSRRGSFVTLREMPNISARARGADATTVNPPSIPRASLEGLTGYLTQGYYAVYLSLQEPFVPGYGVGNSVFLQRQAARLLQRPDILTRPYPERIQSRGWSAYGNWASIYPWIASDVTFPGTVVVIFLIGWLVGRVWIDVLGGANPCAVALLCPLLLMVYYFPAHNKLMQSGEGVVGLFSLVLLWAATRRAAVPQARIDTTRR